jgi:molecular chaperone GrpE
MGKKDEAKSDLVEEEVKEIESDSINTDEIKKLSERITELENQWKRALADYQNLEKRVREERVAWIESANRDILLRLLPVLDTLILASKHSEDKNIGVSVAQFLDALKSEGVTKIETKGKEFDPNTMECVTTTEGEEGKVIEEIRPGYKLHDKILRVAQVVVGKTATSN